MAASVSKPNATTSSESSTLQEPHEQTPLLESNRDTNATSTSAGHLASQLQLSNPPNPASEDITTVSESVREREDEKSSTNIVGVISVLLLGAFIANADGTIVLATYSTICSELGSMENASWVVVSYNLAMCAIQPTYGKLSDIYGRKSALIAAYTLFTFGCALCGAGVNMWQVLLGRAIAGLGGAGMTALVSILIADKVPLRDIATWRSYVNIASTVGRSAGGPIGGFLADSIGWRWSFFLQCPLALLAIFLVALKLERKDASLPPKVGSQSWSKFRRIDFLGSVSLALTIIGFLLFVDLGGQKIPWDHPAIWILLASSVAMGVLFLLIEGYVAREPIFPLRLLVHRDVVTAYILMASQLAGGFGMLYTIPAYFQVTKNASITNAGFHLVPPVVGNTIGGLLSGVVIKRTAAYKLLTLIGTLASVTCFLLLVLRWRGHTSFWESLYIAPAGFGNAVVFATTFVGLAAGVDETQMAIAGTGLYLSANIGGLVGASLAGKILQASLRTGLNAGLKDFPDGQLITEKTLSDLNYLQKLHGKVREIVFDAYIDSFTNTYYMPLACAVLATLVALCMREHDLG